MPVNDIEIGWEARNMPAGYEKMRDAFKKSGMSDKAAKEKAARIWNAKHPKNPLAGKKHGR
jgi:uncharacterized protein YjbK